MKIRLRSAVRGLGRKGEVVEAAEAYARNYLFPQQLAEPATVGVLAQAQAAERRAAAEQSRRQHNAAELQQRLAGATVAIPAAANPQGKLFAAVKQEHIQSAIQRQLGLHVTTAITPGTIKTLGEHPMSTRVNGVDVNFTVRITHGA